MVEQHQIKCDAEEKEEEENKQKGERELFATAVKIESLKRASNWSYSTSRKEYNFDDDKQTYWKEDELRVMVKKHLDKNIVTFQYVTAQVYFTLLLKI